MPVGNPQPIGGRALIGTSPGAVASWLRREAPAAAVRELRVRAREPPAASEGCTVRPPIVTESESASVCPCFAGAKVRVWL